MANDKTAQVLDGRYGVGVTETIGKAINEYYGVWYQVLKYTRKFQVVEETATSLIKTEYSLEGYDSYSP